MFEIITIKTDFLLPNLDGYLLNPLPLKDLKSGGGCDERYRGGSIKPKGFSALSTSVLQKILLLPKEAPNTTPLSTILKYFVHFFGCSSS